MESGKIEGSHSDSIAWTDDPKETEALTHLLVSIFLVKDESQQKTEQARQRGKWSPRGTSKRNWVVYSKLLSPAKKNFIRGSSVNMQKSFSGHLAVRMNVCSPLPPNFIRWNFNSQCDGIRMWGLWNVIRSWGWSPHDGNSTLIKETPEIYFAPITMWKHKNGYMQGRTRVLIRNQVIYRPNPNLGFPTTRTVRNKYLLFEPPSL